MSRLPVMREIAQYIGFDGADAQTLAAMRPAMQPYFRPIVDGFYDAIRVNPGARSVFESEEQIERLKHTLREWLAGVFSGVYDDAYYAPRARIGEVHVRIQLDQRYMFGAMNILRVGLHSALEEIASRGDALPVPRVEVDRAIDRICDLELAIMLETYRDAYVSKLRRTERLATLGQLAASIGHELRNPLAVVETSVHLLERRMGDDERVRKHLGRIAEQVTISSRIIQDLLEMARDRAPSRQEVSVVDLLDNIRDALPPHPGTELVVEVADDARIAHADPGQLRQVLMNLVLNAVQALEGQPDGRVDVGSVRRNGSVVLRVADNGPGLTEDALANVFEPLFTTKARGIGLGLALCRQIVDKHGGSIRGFNREGGGAVFEVVLHDEKSEEVVP